jgi:hypothetical protein
MKRLRLPKQRLKELLMRRLRLPKKRLRLPKQRLENLEKESHQLKLILKEISLIKTTKELHNRQATHGNIFLKHVLVAPTCLLLTIRLLKNAKQFV